MPSLRLPDSHTVPQSLSSVLLPNNTSSSQEDRKSPQIGSRNHDVDKVAPHIVINGNDMDNFSALSEPTDDFSLYKDTVMRQNLTTNASIVSPVASNNILMDTNLKEHNKALIAYLNQQGLNMNPLKLSPFHIKEKSIINNLGHHHHGLFHLSPSANPNIETFITGNGQILFLPYNPQKKKRRRRNRSSQDEYNDEDNDHEDMDDNEQNMEADEPYDPCDYNNASCSNILNDSNTQQNIQSSELNHNITYHTFGVIVKIRKSTSLNQLIKVDYHTHLSLKWSGPDYSKKEPIDERFKCSENINWDLNLSNPDCYIPMDLNADPSINTEMSTIDDSSDSISMESLSNLRKYSDIEYSAKPTQNIKKYTPLSSKNLVPESTQLNNDTFVEENMFQATIENSTKSFSAGYYIFLLPVVYPLNTPETIYLRNAALQHSFSIQIQKGAVAIPTLKAPQTVFLSTSPTHNKHYDDQSNSFSSALSSQTMVNVNDSISTTNTLKSSFFKKLGIRRNSVSSNTSDHINIGSPPTPMKQNPFNTHHSKNPTIYHYNYKLPAIRLPPSDATSTLNKSIYVNKVWNDALNYELLLPRKFTQLSPPKNIHVGANDKFLKENNYLLQMKLVPLQKSLLLKRIKINIVEKVTYISNSIPVERKNTRSEERVISMLEITTKEKQTFKGSGSQVPLKTHIIKDCQNDNLLTYCYEAETSSDPKKKFTSEVPVKAHSHTTNTGFHPSSILKSPKKSSKYSDSQQDTCSFFTEPDVVITNPVKLQCPLNFVANDDEKFIASVYDHLSTDVTDLNELNDLPESSSKVDSMSIFSVNSANDNHDQFSDDDSFGLTSKFSPKRQRGFSFSSLKSKDKETGASPSDKSDSHTFLPDTTSPHIKIRHRLQISFRISKPDLKLKNPDGKPKMHHYEVIVDTPIVLISPFCVVDALELPSYDDAVNMKTFDCTLPSNKFSISPVTSDDLAFADLDSDPTFAPCSPLMSGTIPQINHDYSHGSPIMSFPGSPITNALGASPQSQYEIASTLPSYTSSEILFNRKRSNSSQHSNANPMNATSLLSAAFAKSRNRANSLNSMLASNEMSSLSLKSSESNSNITLPPNYNEIRKDDTGIPSIPPVYDTVVENSLKSKVETVLSPQYIDKSRLRVDKPVNIEAELKDTLETDTGSKLSVMGSMNEQENTPFDARSSLSKASTASENLKLINEDENKDSDLLMKLHSTSSFNINLDTETRPNSLEVNSREDIESIVNMNVGKIATLNLTTSHNER